MICRASEKVAGGKLVRLELEHDGSRILRAKITGDFFLHPEDAITNIEHSLAGLSITSGATDFFAKISECLKASSAETVGFSAETIANLLVQAISTGEQK